MPVWLQIARSYSNPESVNYKIAYLREQLKNDLGKLAYEDQVQVAMLGETVIIGGFLNTELIAADSILTNHLAAGAVTSDKIDVNTLSAISANIGDVTAGSLTGVTITGSTIRTAASGTRAEMGGGSTPYFDTYLGNIKRMRLESDRLNFYDENGTWGGNLISQVYSDNYPAISLIGNRVVEIKSSDPNPSGSTRAASVWTETMPNDPPMVHAVAYDLDTNSYSGLHLGVDARLISLTGDVILQPYDLGNNIVKIIGNLDVSGSLSKGSGTFLIDHPLDPDNKDLVHGFVESPKYELIYRGKVQLIDGVAEVDIDAMCDMSEGTFEALTQNAEVVSLCNLTGFSRVKPTKIVGGKFTIVAEEKVSDEISWVVMAERADYFIINGDRWTDEKGRLIPEHNKPEYKSGDTSRKEGTIGYPRHFKKRQGSKGGGLSG